MTVAKVDLGRRLFYDTRLSGNGTFACATCHQQARAFTDGRARALGSTGALHARSSMSLANVAYNASLGWADPTLRTLEEQMAVPMFNEHPIELGLKGREDEIVARFAGQADDRAGSARRFPDDGRRSRWRTSSRRSRRSSARSCPATRRSTAISIATTRARCRRRRCAA